jgi:hypothetical protein
MAIGDDTALRELFAQHALAGGHEPVHRPAAAAVRRRLRGRGPQIRQAVQAALLWAALHWHWNTAGLVIAAGVALITVLGRRESGREFRPGKLSGDDLQGA